VILIDDSAMKEGLVVYDVKNRKEYVLAIEILLILSFGMTLNRPKRRMLVGYINLNHNPPWNKKSHLMLQEVTRLRAVHTHHIIAGLITAETRMGASQTRHGSLTGNKLSSSLLHQHL
jgi:hypothetical protein